MSDGHTIGIVRGTKKWPGNDVSTPHFRNKISSPIVFYGVRTYTLEMPPCVVLPYQDFAIRLWNSRIKETRGKRSLDANKTKVPSKRKG